MFGKLVKYEMKSMMKIFAGLWVAVLVVATISGFTLNINAVGTDNFFFPQLFANETVSGLLEIVPLIVYFALAVSIVALSVVFIIQRFYNGLLGNEGYLMNTLPTTSRALISAKGFSSTLIVVISGIVGALSLLLFSLPVIIGSDISEVLKAIGQVINQYPSIILAGVLGIVIVILSVINFIYHVYMSIAIGHLFTKHRIAMAVVAFVGTAIILDIIETAGLFLLGRFIDVENWIGELTFVNGQVNYDTRIFITFGILAVLLIVGIIIYHAITEFILRRKLNLE